MPELCQHKVIGRWLSAFRYIYNFLVVKCNCIDASTLLPEAHLLHLDTLLREWIIFHILTACLNENRCFADLNRHCTFGRDREDFLAAFLKTVAWHHLNCFVRASDSQLIITDFTAVCCW